jgi:hypothetical protein
MTESMKDTVEISFLRDDIPVSETNSKFESIISLRAEEALVSMGGDPSWYRLSDIGIDDVGYTVIMKKIDGALREEVQGASYFDEAFDEGASNDVEFSLDEESPEVGGDEESEVKPSAAYDGPWEERKFEMDIVQICALMDIVNFCMSMAKPPPEGPGMITETLPRSLSVMNNFCIRNACVIDEEKVMEAVRQGKQLAISPDPDFDHHFQNWMKESIDLFEERHGAARKKVVQARMMPGAGFDPRGGQHGPNHRGIGGIMS